MNYQNCGNPLSDSASFCGKCGTKVHAAPQQPVYQAGEVECPTCKSKNPVGTQICRVCNAPLYKKQSSNNTTLLIVLISIVAVLLIAILGIVLHNFSGNNTSQPANPTQEVVVESPTPIPTQPPAPVFPNISASSTRGTDYTAGNAVNYYPEYAVDAVFETAWSSNRELELTPSITLSSGTAQYVTGVRVANGYFKSEQVYRNNRRITKFLIEYEGGQIVHECGIEQYRIMQDIRFDVPVYTNYIKVHVLESYQGKWKDIAISEIEVY